MQAMKWLGAAALLFAGVAQAQTMNTCEASFPNAPREGRHTQDTPTTTADAVLWPPNHKLRTFTIAASNNEGDECNVTITGVFQDEATDEIGSGNTSTDAANCSNTGNQSKVDLRAERSGTLDGRYYRVDFTMDDPDAPGQPKTDSGFVLVPHDQGIKKLFPYDQNATVIPSNAMMTCAP